MKLYELWKSSHEAKKISILVLFFFWFVFLSISPFLSLDSSFSLAYITPPSSPCHSDLWTSISNHLLPPAAKAITPFPWPLSVSLCLSLLSLSLSLSLSHTRTHTHTCTLTAARCHAKLHSPARLIRQMNTFMMLKLQVRTSAVRRVDLTHLPVSKHHKPWSKSSTEILNCTKLTPHPVHPFI